MLSGFAWSEAIGWISFSCKSGGNCSDNDYGVTIDSVTGDFSGYAWNDVIGWISFNGLINPPGAGSYKVSTGWRSFPVGAELTSSIIDAGSSVHWNTLKWLKVPGALDVGSVQFQVATLNNPSTMLNDWTFVDPDSCGAGVFSTALLPSISKIITCQSSSFQNTRYLRYKIRLTSNLARTQSPRVDDIIITWSR